MGRSTLEYTPQAFPAARTPDGPAPGMEERLVHAGLAHRLPPEPPFATPSLPSVPLEAPPRAAPIDLATLAFVGLSELEESLRKQPPPGVTEAEVAELMRRNWQPLTESLVSLLREATAPRIGWVVLARVEPEPAIAKQGGVDLGGQHQIKQADKPVAMVWAQDASESERQKAIAFAQKEGYMLLTYPSDEVDPLGRAKEDAVLRLSGEAHRALQSLRASRIERLRQISDAGDAGFAPHHKTDKAKLAAWTRELELFKRWGLVSYDGRWRATTLGRRVVELATDTARRRTRRVHP